MTLTIAQRDITSVFGISRVDENSATHAIGYALDRCPAFRKLFVRKLLGARVELSEPRITLQRHDRDRGYTDLEIRSPSLHVIIEAKQGWTLPTLVQLQRYAARVRASSSPYSLLVTLSAADQDHARRHNPSRVDRVPVQHLSWSQVRSCAEHARARTRARAERALLNELEKHLEEFEAMDRRDSNQVFVVSLGLKPMMRGKRLTWIDVVEKQRRYFHLIGSTWPVTPPNYVGFRYHGRLQSVHHVEGYEVVRNLRDKHPEWPRTRADHFVYRLGPPMKPAAMIRTGRLYRNARVWCAIDTLLSGACSTVADARDATKRREQRTR